MGQWFPNLFRVQSTKNKGKSPCKYQESQQYNLSKKSSIQNHVHKAINTQLFFSLILEPPTLSFAP